MEKMYCIYCKHYSIQTEVCELYNKQCYSYYAVCEQYEKDEVLFELIDKLKNINDYAECNTYDFALIVDDIIDFIKHNYNINVTVQLLNEAYVDSIDIVSMIINYGSELLIDAETLDALFEYINSEYYIYNITGEKVILFKKDTVDASLE